MIFVAAQCTQSFPSIANGNVHPDKSYPSYGPIPADTIATYSCNAGFHLHGFFAWYCNDKGSLNFLGS